MDKRITQILEMVWEINRRGGELVFDMRNNGFQVYDVADGCRNLMYYTGVDETAIYFAEWFEDKYELCISLYIEELKRKLNSEFSLLEVEDNE